MNNQHKEALKAFTENVAKQAEELFTKLFGVEVSEIPYTEMTNFQIVCKVIGVNPNDYIVTEDMHPRKKHSIYNDKLELIYEAINGTWSADLNSPRQAKYRIWYHFPSADSGFTLGGFTYVFTTTDISSRLYCESEEKCRFIFNNFYQEIGDYLTS